MPLPPARCWRKKERPYTRQSKHVPRKSYVKGVPDSKLHRFETGDPKADYDLKGLLVSKEEAQIRSNALEAARVAATRYIEKNVGKTPFLIKMRVVPFHVLRQHKQAAVAQADRLFDGMGHPFGKPIGIAAQVKPEQPIIEIRTKAGFEDVLKEAMRRASSKLPIKCKKEIEKIKKQKT